MYGLSLAEVLKGEILKIFREGIVAFAMAMVEGVAATYVRATTPIVFSLV
ncbi:MAG: hypothetical protein LM590_00195 [Thermofilum sp.]|jgi:PTS system mannose-specific IID component|nr:hypothetical protein [Thermofilum sp.]